MRIILGFSLRNLESKQPVPKIQPGVQLFTYYPKGKLVIHTIAGKGDTKSAWKKGLAVSGKHPSLYTYFLGVPFKKGEGISAPGQISGFPVNSQLRCMDSAFFHH
jgi:hypothetical protein